MYDEDGLESKNKNYLFKINLYYKHIHDGSSNGRLNS